jgi:hypothetical protein
MLQEVYPTTLQWTTCRRALSWIVGDGGHVRPLPWLVTPLSYMRRQRSDRELRETNRFPQLERIEHRMLVEAERFVGAITLAIE